MKLFKRILLTIVVVLVVLIIGLIINNRILYIKYNGQDTKKDALTEKEINRVHEVFDYLNSEGNSLFHGFDGKSMNLLVYNEGYEFLFSDFEPAGSEWTALGQDEATGKLMFRRTAVNSQAFAVKIDNTWVGSFATMDTYHKEMLNQLPIFYPPQLIVADEQYYKALVIHEMVHAFQGRYNTDRIDAAEHINDVCSSYYNDSDFNQLIEQEAGYLEAALQAEDTDTIQDNVQSFLITREQRRTECGMTDQDIHNEQELEWLEGLARYAELKASAGSSSPIAKGLSDISEKVKVSSDDRYYTLGMAEYRLILALDKAYETEILNSDSTLEDLLYKLCNQ